MVPKYPQEKTPLRQSDTHPTISHISSNFVERGTTYGRLLGQMHFLGAKTY